MASDLERVWNKGTRRNNHEAIGPLGRVSGAWATARGDLLRRPTCTMRGAHVGNAEPRVCGGVGTEGRNIHRETWLWTWAAKNWLYDHEHGQATKINRGKKSLKWKLKDKAWSSSKLNISQCSLGETTNEVGNKLIGFSSQLCQSLPFQAWVLWEPQFPRQLNGWVGLMASECYAVSGFSAQVP